MQNQEIWKPVVGYEGLYEVSNTGKVRSLDGKRWTGRAWGVKKGRILKACIYGGGYYIVVLCKNGIKKTNKVHRLVAQAFLPNHENLPCINHKDEVKTNNHVENLEWCTHKYNMEYSGNIEKATKASIEKENWRKANEATSKPVTQYTKDGQFVAEYPSAQEAGRRTGIKQSSISSCCNGKIYKSAGGYIWRYSKNEKERERNN